MDIEQLPALGHQFSDIEVLADVTIRVLTGEIPSLTAAYFKGFPGIEVALDAIDTTVAKHEVAVVVV